MVTTPNRDYTLVRYSFTMWMRRTSGPGTRRHTFSRRVRTHRLSRHRFTDSHLAKYPAPRKNHTLQTHITTTTAQVIQTLTFLYPPSTTNYHLSSLLPNSQKQPIPHIPQSRPEHPILGQLLIDTSKPELRSLGPLLCNFLHSLCSSQDGKHDDPLGAPFDQGLDGGCAGAAGGDDGVEDYG